MNTMLRVEIAIASHEGFRSQRIKCSRAMAASIAEAIVAMLAETSSQTDGHYEIEIGDEYGSNHGT